ncbi:MAG: PQQ-binding-like beta-propeller repeat protein, partial [Dongiaceae bacterium]
MGAIGKPRGRPHLHFEIRTHTPDDPGPGYWPVDPLLAGWKNPSDTIWNYRLRISPGIQWTRPFTATGSSGIGLLGDGTLVAVDDRRLMGIDPLDGSLRWSRPLATTVYRSAIDATGSMIYLSNHIGSVQAFDVPGVPAANAAEGSGAPAWQIDVGASNKAAVMPLPGGGVAIQVGQQLLGVSTSGERMWQIAYVAPPFAWTLAGEQLIYTSSTADPILHAVDRSGRVIWAGHIGGRPAAAGDHVFVYGSNGIYRLDLAARMAELAYPLDAGVLEMGDIAATPDDGVIVSHRGQTDSRLILINADGTLRWDR